MSIATLAEPLKSTRIPQLGVASGVHCSLLSAVPSFHINTQLIFFNNQIYHNFHFVNTPSCLLTVAIPTYNRRENLLRVIAILIPIMKPELKLLIIDNASNYSVVCTVNALLEAYPAINFEVVRNVANIGASANTLRCLELASTEWVWILGDDDEPVASCFNDIEAVLRKYPTAACLNFSSSVLHHVGVERTSPKVCRNLQMLAVDLDSFGNLLFISANLYRRSALLPFLKIGYFQIHTCGAHVSLLLAAVQAGAGDIILLPEFLVQRALPSEEQRWDSNLVYFSLPSIFDVVNNLNTRCKLNKLNIRNHALSNPNTLWRGDMKAFLNLVYRDGLNPSIAADLFISKALVFLRSGSAVWLPLFWILCYIWFISLKLLIKVFARRRLGPDEEMHCVPRYTPRKSVQAMVADLRS